uniref:Uncharacterized protein n=1 Tax=Heterosigma akashiwo TaxID=2829 RepID=A0A7S3XU13_HETAK
MGYSYTWLASILAMLIFTCEVASAFQLSAAGKTMLFGRKEEVQRATTKSLFGSSGLLFSPKRGSHGFLAAQGDDALNEEEEKLYSSGKVVLTPEQKRIRNLSNGFQNAAWTSWWAQVILSTVAGVILFFASAITDPRVNMFMNGTLLAGCGVFFGLVSTFWTWGYASAAKRWKRPGADLEKLQRAMLRRLQFGQFVNILGMAVALTGAEQIVGTLVAKVLSAQGLSPFLGGAAVGYAAGQPLVLPQGAVQALDIFVVQANTNSVVSHLCGLLTVLYLRGRARRLAAAGDAGAPVNMKPLEQRQ